MSKDKTVRVLVTAPLGVGGITNMMINIQAHLNRNLINFDYLVFHDREEPMEKAVVEMGSKKLVASVDNIKFRFLRKLARVWKIASICRKNNVKIMHYNADNPLDVMNIFGAKLGGVKFITIHCHNSSFLESKGLIKFIGKLFQILIPKLCDCYLSCSELAAKALFPKNILNEKKYFVLPNAIDLEKFSYAPDVRDRVRKDMGINDKFVLGHVGRFSKVKNHSFLINIFYALHKKDSNSILLLCGEGETLEKMKEKVHKLGLDDNVIFLGATNKMDKIWQAIDVFCMPSFNEGFPVTAVEAQASGVFCVFSDTITREVDIIGKSDFLSLKDPINVWVDHILMHKRYIRKNEIQKLKEAKYDIQQTADILSDLYIDVFSKWR